MKKVLSTALILGALYGTANAAPVTSPIYMPEAGKILSELNIGYTQSKFDKKPEDTKDKLYQAWNIGLHGQFGLMERVSMNYGFDFDFARKLFDEDTSAAFKDFYLGVTGRVLDMGVNKLDIIFNIGQNQDPLAVLNDQVFVDLAARYGLDLDVYNLGFTVGIRYNNDYERANGSDADGNTVKYKAEKDFDIHLALENEFIFTENFTVGLDLYYNMYSKLKLKNDFFDGTDYSSGKVKGYNEYGFTIDANYGFDANNFIGLYFDMAFNDAKYYPDETFADDIFKDAKTYKFGVKFTSQF